MTERDDRLPTATLVAELRTAADVAQAIADSVRIEEYRFQTRQEADLLRQAADRLEELEAAVDAARAEERERCAKVALAHGETIGERCWNHENGNDAVSSCWEEIAFSIREEPTT